MPGCEIWDVARGIFETQAELHGAGQDINDALRARMHCQQVLYQDGKRIEVLITESALRHPVC